MSSEISLSLFLSQVFHLCLRLSKGDFLSLLALSLTTLIFVSQKRILKNKMHKIRPLDLRMSGASLWDLRQCSWSTSTRPRNNPEELCLQQYARSLGVDNQTPVVVYDRTDMQDAARTWWTLSSLHGRQKVVVLDGGWTEWTRRGLPTTFGRYRQFYNDVRGNWVAKYRPSRGRNLAQMTADVRTGQRQVRPKEKIPVLPVAVRP